VAYQDTPPGPRQSRVIPAALVDAAVAEIVLTYVA
jgi:hypothetical protein